MNYEYSVGPRKLSATTSIDASLAPELVKELLPEIESALETETYIELVKTFIREEWEPNRPGYFNVASMVSGELSQLAHEEFGIAFLKWALKLAQVEIITKTIT
ncbi:hypothetical protein D3C87_583690 [compost metagenome]